jgi:hypothetical protein
MSAFYNPVVFGGDAAGPASALAVNQATGAVAGVFSISSPVSLGGGAVAASGSLRAPNNVTVIAVRNAANTADIILLNVNNTNGLTIGDHANLLNVTIDGGTAGQTIFNIGGAQHSAFLSGTFRPGTDNAIGLGIAGTNAWSTVAAYKHEFTNTADPATPTAGPVAYGKAGALWVIGTSGTKTQVAPA